jgi:ATP-dependent protease Clp ATPase subunit
VVPRIVAKVAVVQIHTAQPVMVDTVQSVEKTPRLVVGVDPAVAQRSIPAVDEVGKVALLHIIVVVVVRRNLVDGSRNVVLKLVEGVGIEVAPLGRGPNNALEVVAGEVDTMDLLCIGTGFDRQVRRQVGMGLGASYDGWVVEE